MSVYYIKIIITTFFDDLSNIALNCKTIIFQLRWKLDVIFTCEYFKFGSNTTGLNQSHFRHFSACGINIIIALFSEISTENKCKRIFYKGLSFAKKIFPYRNDFIHRVIGF